MIGIETFHARARVLMEKTVMLLIAEMSDSTMKTEFENETTSDAHPRTMRQLLKINWMETKLGNVKRHSTPA